MRFNLLLLFLLLAYSAWAQSGQVSGRLLDATSQEPLPFGSVFINNTTIGTNTTLEGTFTLKNIPPGIHEFIFSFIGYQSYQIKIEVKEGQVNSPLTIKLIPLESQLSEVEVKGSRDKVWEKQLKRFEKVFLGEGPSAAGCKIINPWVIDFTEEGKVLTAKASFPLEIVNEHLGYRVFFHMKDFRFSGDRYSIIGNSRYEELTATESSAALKWSQNREKAYVGSVRHLMKSIVDKRMAGEGFRLYADKVKNTARSNNFSYELAHNIIPYDTSTIVSAAPAPGEYRIQFKDKIEVHNIYELSKAGFYKDVSDALSWIEVKGGYARVNKEGVLLNASEVVISGDMASVRIAQLLPLDYTKGKIITVPTNEGLSAKRLQEKIYVSTDKPYYYPGETIWLSAFANYRAFGVRDTLSKVMYVDLIDKDRAIVHSSVLRIDSGRAIGNFKLPLEFKSGDYVLRAYTNWMRNYGVSEFFYKRMPVLDLTEQLVVKDVLKTDSGNLVISFDQSIYHKREKVTFRLNLKDENDSLIRANLSVSVTDNALVSMIKEEPTILTHYSMADELPRSMLGKFVHPIERGITMSGTFFNKKNKPAKSQLTVIKENWEDFYQIYSDDKGYFSIPGLIFYDSMRFGVQSEGGRIVLKEETKPIGVGNLPEYSYQIVKSGSIRNSIYEPDQGVILLKEVEVKSDQLSRGKTHDSPYGKPELSFLGEDLEKLNPNLASAIEMKVPGLQLIYQDNHWFLIWRRAANITLNAFPEPALYIDNALIQGETAGDRLYSTNTAMIDHIEYSSPINSQLGANGSFGVIFVFLKKAVPEQFKAIPIVKLRGFDSPKVFQGPVYDGSERKNDSDFRPTLYWNPKVALNYSSRPTELSFYTSDFAGTYRLVVEGVTEKGQPIRAEKIITVID